MKTFYAFEMSGKKPTNSWEKYIFHGHQTHPQRKKSTIRIHCHYVALVRKIWSVRQKHVYDPSCCSRLWLHSGNNIHHSWQTHRSDLKVAILIPLYRATPNNTISDLLCPSFGKILIINSKLWSTTNFVKDIYANTHIKSYYFQQIKDVSSLSSPRKTTIKSYFLSQLEIRFSHLMTPPTPNPNPIPQFAN